MEIKSRKTWLKTITWLITYVIIIRITIDKKHLNNIDLDYYIELKKESK